MRPTLTEQILRPGRPSAPWFSAITVTHDPPLGDGRLAKQAKALAQVADLHVIVDNGSGNVNLIRGALQESSPGGRYLVVPLDQNTGMASALNVGVRTCLEKSSVDWVLLLDQDTCFPMDSFGKLANELATIKNQARLGVIGFNCVRHRLTLESLSNSSGHVRRRRSVMTSGSLVSREVLQRIPFDESLFMYYVDVDFCHRVEGSGYAILQLFSSMADVQEGQSIERGGAMWSVLDPWRLYFVGRNGVRTFRRFGHAADIAYASMLLSGNILAGHVVSQSIVHFVRGVIEGLSY